MFLRSNDSVLCVKENRIGRLVVNIFDLTHRERSKPIRNMLSDAIILETHQHYWNDTIEYLMFHPVFGRTPETVVAPEWILTVKDLGDRYEATLTKKGDLVKLHDGTMVKTDE